MWPWGLLCPPPDRTQRPPPLGTSPPISSAPERLLWSCFPGLEMGTGLRSLPAIPTGGLPQLCQGKKKKGQTGGRKTSLKGHILTKGGPPFWLWLPCSQQEAAKLNKRRFPTSGSSESSWGNRCVNKQLQCNVMNAKVEVLWQALQRKWYLRLAFKDGEGYRE